MQQQQHHMPHAPPPPPPMQRQAFPGMPGLVNDFSRVHLEPTGHHFEHHMQQPAIQVIQPPGYGHAPDPRSIPTNGKPPIGYVGYTFTKHPVEHVGQKETWAIVDKELIPASQVDLKTQAEKHRRKGVTGLDQYMDPDMKGFKRKQIDELIRECVAMDPDHRFEYIIASIKRDTRRRQSGIETSTMQVILKRQARPGIVMQGPFMGFGNLRLPMSGVVDLSGAEEYEKSSQNSSNGHKPGAYPFERHLSEPWVHVVHPDVRPPAQHALSHDHAHPHDHPHPHDPGNAHGHGHDDSGGKEAHGLEQPNHHHHDHHPLFHEEAHDTKYGHEEKAKKHKDKEHKSPKIVHVHKDESHKVHDYSDDSLFSDSDSSSGDTDRTPDTIISSEGSHYHRKDKKYHKSKHHRKSSSHDHGHEPVKVIYREHRRKQPTRRHSSPPPPSHGSRHRHEDVIVEPSHSYHRRAEPSYPRERFAYDHRAMNYDEERFHDHDMRGFARRPTVYSRRIGSTAHSMDPYEERRRHEMLDREIREKEEAFRRRERHRREAARGRMDSDRMFAAPHPRMDRMHSYHDDHFHGYHDDHY